MDRTPFSGVQRVGPVTALEWVKVNARLWVRDRGCTAPLIADGVPPCYPPESDSVPSSVPIAGVPPTTQLAGEAVVRVDHRTSWALVNPSADRPVQVTLRLVDLQGNLVGKADVTLAPLHRIGRFLSEFEGMEESPTHFNGVLKWKARGRSPRAAS